MKCSRGQSCHSPVIWILHSDLGSDPCTPMVRDHSDLTSDHPPAAVRLAQGLTSDDKGGEGLIAGLGSGQCDLLTTDSESLSSQFSSTDTTSMNDPENLSDTELDTATTAHTS